MGGACAAGGCTTSRNVKPYAPSTAATTAKTAPQKRRIVDDDIARISQPTGEACWGSSTGVRKRRKGAKNQLQSRLRALPNPG